MNKTEKELLEEYENLLDGINKAGQKVMAHESDKSVGYEKTFFEYNEELKKLMEFRKEHIEFFRSQKF